MRLAGNQGSPALIPRMTGCNPTPSNTSRIAVISLSSQQSPKRQKPSSEPVRQLYQSDGSPEVLAIYSLACVMHYKTSLISMLSARARGPAQRPSSADVAKWSGCKMSIDAANIRAHNMPCRPSFIHSTISEERSLLLSGQSLRVNDKPSLAREPFIVAAAAVAVLIAIVVTTKLFGQCSDNLTCWSDVLAWPRPGPRAYPHPASPRQ